jgi:hypothetical protein
VSAQFFAADYAEARAQFGAAAETAGLDVHSHLHPLLGAQGEVLALDVARRGPADAAALLIVSSGCHGPEGFCGSGVQNALLADADFARAAHGAGVAVLFIHALNPYGFSWLRRVTQENVDLNRNFQDFAQPLPANPGYEELAHLIVPPTWPPTPENEAQLMAYAAAHGERALQQAMTAGQYSHPDGLFFGGHNPTWSRQTVRHVLQDHAQHCRRLAWIDLHTGLGPSGHGELIFAARDDAATLARARTWWGPGVTSIYDGSSSSARISGMLFEAAYLEAPQAQYTGIALEYGTVPLLETLNALRADQWLENHPEADAATRSAIKRQMRDAFYVDTDEWKAQIVVQGVAAARAAIAGLAA